MAIFGVFIVPAIIVAVVLALELGGASRYIVLFDVGTLLDAANAWFFGIVPTSGVWPLVSVPRLRSAWSTSIVMAIGSSAILVQRYRTIVA